jgi:IS5 family transposase
MIGQEQLGIGPMPRWSSPLDKLSELIAWPRIVPLLEPLYQASKGERAWPPLAMFKALLLAVWYDLSDVKLAEALEDRASFRRFCGFSSSEATPERTAFVRFRRALITHGLDRTLFETVTAELKAKSITVKTSSLVMPRSLPPRARPMGMDAGSSAKAVARCMASRPMSEPMRPRPWSRRSR